MTKTSVASIAIALASLAGGQAMAANIDATTGVDLDAVRAAMQTPSTMTRAQVKAGVIAANAAHKADVVDSTTGLNITELRNQMSQPIVKTRAQVREEAVQARKNAPARPYWETVLI